MGNCQEVDLEDFLHGGCAGTTWGATCLVPAKGPPPSDAFALWLGSADDALDIDGVKERGISAIVNMAAGGCEEEKSYFRALSAKDKKLCTAEELRFDTAEFNQEWYRHSTGCTDFMYLSIDAEDSPSFPIWKHFDEVTEFLRACRQAGKPVLVHCMQGVNRSATVCAAFLAREGIDEGPGGTGLGVLKAVDWISQRRQPVLLNARFVRQLVEHGSPQAEWQEPERGIDAGGDRPAFEVGAVVERGVADGSEEAGGEAGPAAPSRPPSKFKASRD